MPHLDGADVRCHTPPEVGPPQVHEHHVAQGSLMTTRGAKAGSNSGSSTSGSDKYSGESSISNSRRGHRIGSGAGRNRTG